MARTLGEARRSQLVTTYGIGAIIAIEDESFMIAGLDRWDVSDQDLWIHEPRLERHCKVRHFILPAASGDDKRDDIPVIRFPRWYSCSDCKTVDQYRRLAPDPDRNECACGGSLVPSRFVMVCEGGHIDDFPYKAWVHGRGAARDGKHELRITTLGVTASLRDIVIRCTCGESRSMEGAFRRAALREVISCTANQPWLSRRDPEGCSRMPRVLQRGASNVWFSVMESAISIPPWSEDAFKALNRYWEAVRHVPDSALSRRTCEHGPRPDERLLSRRTRRSGTRTSRRGGLLRRSEYRRHQGTGVRGAHAGQVATLREAGLRVRSGHRRNTRGRARFSNR